MSPTLLLLSALFAYGYPAPGEVEADTREVLQDERYAFCDEERSYIPVGDEVAWCPLIGPNNDRCRGYHAHCSRDHADSGGYGGDASPTFNERKRRDRRGLFNDAAGGDDPKPAPQVRINREMSSLSQLLLWGLAIAGGLFLLWSIVSSRGTGRDEDEQVDAEGAGPLPPELAAGDAARRLIETDVNRLLERARRAASEGEYRQAVDDVYAALLRRLDGDGLIEIHHARTNGDYVRDLRERPELSAEVRQILRDVERVQFGRTEADASVFRKLIDRVGPLVTRQLGALLLAFGLGAAFGGCGLGDDEHDGLAGLGTDVMGGRAMVQLLRRNDIEAHHRTRTLEQLRESQGVLLLFGDVSPTPEEWDGLLEWTDQGGTLVVATGNDDLPPELDLQLAPSSRPANDGSYLQFVDGYQYTYEQLTVRVPAFTRLERSGRGFSPDRLLIRPDPEPEDEELDEFGLYADEYQDTGELYAVRLHRREGEVIVFADELLFTNASMAVEDNARFVVELMASFEGDVEVIDEWTGTGAQTPLESIANSHLTPVVLQVLALMLLLYLWRGIAFARLRDPPAKSRRAFVDHVHALALQYAKARASRHVLSIYAGWVMERLRDRVAPGTGRSLHGLAQAIAARTGRDEGKVMRLLVEAHTVRESASHASGVYSARRRDLDLMRELTQLLALSTRSKKRR